MNFLPWQRREFLKAGAATTAALTLGCSTRSGGSLSQSEAPRLRTPLCDLLGIEYPILQSGMGGVAGAELTAAVSEAGGLGILGGAFLDADELRRRIHEVRRRTDRPFGVNLLLHTQVWPPVESSTIPDQVVQAVQTVLNRFRQRLGLPPSSARPATRPNLVPAALEVILDERVPIFSIGLGNPPRELVERFHARGAKVIAMAATVDDARELGASGVDVIVAQGHEAGGHRSTWVKRASAEDAHIGTMTLVPQVADAVNVPVVAAGGISNGKGLVAALALGAQGVMLGTRFVATRESLAPEFYKQALADRDSDATTVTDAYSGLYARVLRNTYTREYAASGAPVLTGYLQSIAVRDITSTAASRQDQEYYPMWAGQGVGMIDTVPSAAEVMAALVREGQSALRVVAEVATS